MSIVQTFTGRRWITVPFLDERGRKAKFANPQEAHNAILDLVHGIDEEHAFNPTIQSLNLNQFRIQSCH